MSRAERAARFQGVITTARETHASVVEALREITGPEAQPFIDALVKLNEGALHLIADLTGNLVEFQSEVEEIVGVMFDD